LKNGGISFSIIPFYRYTKQKTKTTTGISLDE
jgi:hypothetical protein